MWGGSWWSSGDQLCDERWGESRKHPQAQGKVTDPSIWLVHWDASRWNHPCSSKTELAAIRSICVKVPAWLRGDFYFLVLNFLLKILPLPKYWEVILLLETTTAKQTTTWQLHKHQPPGQEVCLVPLSFFFLNFLATPCGMWDLSAPTRDGTRASYSGSLES